MIFIFHEGPSGGRDKIYDPRLRALSVISPKLKTEINSPGSFSFTLPPNHPAYNDLQPFASWVTIEDGTDEIFRSRVVDIEQENIYGDLTVLAEGSLAVLNDSIVRPHTFRGTVAAYVKYLIDNHNKACRDTIVPEVNIAGAVDVEQTDHESTWAILSKLAEEHGGALKLSGRRLSWAPLDTRASGQEIRVDKNLLSYSCEWAGADLKTVIIPTANKMQLDPIENAEAVQRYGRIWGVFKSEAKTADVLRQQAAAYLAQVSAPIKSIEIEAADLSYIRPDAERFRLGDHIRVVVPAYGVDESMILQEIEYDIDKAAEKRIRLGAKRATLTGEAIRKPEQQAGSAGGSVAPEYTVTDSKTGKAYRWKVTIINGTPKIEIEEV